MNLKKIELVLGTLTLAFAFFSWQSVARAVRITDSSTWFIPIILFSIYLTLVCLDIVLFKKTYYLNLLLLGSLILSIVFTWNPWHLLGIVVGGCFLFLSSKKIRHDLELNIKIELMKSLAVGKFMLLLAVSSVIAAQYFSIVKDMEGQKLIPHIEIGGISKEITIKFLSSFDPNFKSLENKNITVDEFILQAEEKTDSSQAPNQDTLDNENSKQMIELELDRRGVPQNQREELRLQAMSQINDLNSKFAKDRQGLILNEGRKQLSEIAGRQVQGSENISDIVSELISNKIESFFAPNVVDQRSSSIAGVLAAILMLTVFSLGSLLSLVFFGLSYLIFFLMARFGLVEIKTITVEKEIIG